MGSPLRNYLRRGQSSWSATKRRRLIERLADQAALDKEENKETGGNPASPKIYMTVL